ncbi:hypothetical protein PHISCL_09394 [Aspergillus sclerotialis]|uniref:SAM-dependent MTase RsmB/NOP-type domain-containing protein n=1 Tax=Aspergillus sclerotialis TaxID=2070753 RepID=A0A3A2Z6G0_9EURO|nr:hypothetical protein PHISCL_09394 [Aspergillus sclerotialis]
MSLYFDAASILTTQSETGGSFKSRIYNSRSKSSPAQIYALITETSKWDLLLKEVIENAGILDLEPKLSPLLALFLVHDFLLSKNGVSAPASHPIRQAVERHKIRLKAEFTKARVRRGCTSIEVLKEAVLKERRDRLDVAGVCAKVYPRWVRVNNLRSSMDAQLGTTFASYKRAQSLAELAGEEPRVYTDPNIPDLLAVTPGMDFTNSPAYKNGEIILQDKASCFPAYLLVGNGEDWEGDLVDGCAAPGNKTTHLASLLAKQGPKKSSKRRCRIFSMDASQARSKTLQKMVTAAGANDIVTILAGQDFLALHPSDSRFSNVTGLLLDPSCSGSGIIGRDDVPQLTLPTSSKPAKGQGKKRKRRHDEDGDQQPPQPAKTVSSTEENELSETNLDIDRLTKLSNLQARIVEHALAFPAATHVTYSTCSIHLIENEAVVSRVLASNVAKRRGWRVMRRDEQPDGLRAWNHRGIREERVPASASRENDDSQPTVYLTDEELDACLRCWPGDEEGLGGFFVAGFIRDPSLAASDDTRVSNDSEEEEEWEGFSD